MKEATVIQFRPGKAAPRLATVANKVTDAQHCPDEQGAAVQYPNGQVLGFSWSKARDVLLIDGYVVGRLTQIPWLAGTGWKLVSVSGRPPVEAPSLPALVREWLAQHGATLPGLRGAR